MTTDSNKTPIVDGIVLGAQVIAAGVALYALKDIDKDELKKTVDTLRDHWSSVIKSK